MRITILQGAFLPVPPLRGGAVEKLWFELGKQFRLKGHSVCHISRTFPGLPNEEIIEGVLHRRVGGHNTPSNAIFLKALDLLYSWKALQLLPSADILITNTFWMPILARDRQNELGQIVVDVERMPKGQMGLYRQAACLRANSSAVERAIMQEAPELKLQIRTIPNPLPYQHSTLSENKRDHTILYCGRMHPEKGISLLIEAFSMACESGLSGWNLELVGAADIAAGGGGEQWLEKLLTQPHAAGLPIKWVGPIYDESELQQRYQKASIFVYPSLAERGETFGLAPLEAMAAGAVPIVSDLACFQDFISPGENGQVFNHRAENASSLLADNFLSLANNVSRRESMSRAALEVCDSHDPSRIADDFLRCFEELTGKPKIAKND
jgi:glycosyltransferase involved in cell wall biosynthesis